LGSREGEKVRENERGEKVGEKMGGVREGSKTDRQMIKIGDRDKDIGWETGIWEWNRERGETSRENVTEIEKGWEWEKGKKES
jgi:hypothetical protein